MNFQGFIKKYQKVAVEEYKNTVPPNVVVSICVLAFQHKEFIRECLDAILGQNVDFPYEILLGEDHSTDGTREICIEYAEKFPEKIRLFLHHRENNIPIGGKPSGRFNYLYTLFSAKGKYIAMCEGDDYWTDSYKLQKQVVFLQKNPNCNLVAHQVKERLDTKLLQSIRNENYNEGKFLLYKNFVPTLSVLYRRKDFLKDLPDYLSSAPMGDLPVHYHFSKKGKLKKWRSYMGVRRIHKGGIWSQLDMIEVLKKGIVAREIMRPFVEEAHIPFLNAGVNRLKIKSYIAKKLSKQDDIENLELLADDYFSFRHRTVVKVVENCNNNFVLKFLLRLL